MSGQMARRLVRRTGCATQPREDLLCQVCISCILTGTEQAPKKLEAQPTKHSRMFRDSCTASPSHSSLHLSKQIPFRSRSFR